MLKFSESVVNPEAPDLNIAITSAGRARRRAATQSVVSPWWNLTPVSLSASRSFWVHLICTCTIHQGELKKSWQGEGYTSRDVERIFARGGGVKYSKWPDVRVFLKYRIFEVPPPPGKVETVGLNINRALKQLKSPFPPGRIWENVWIVM